MTKSVKVGVVKVIWNKGNFDPFKGNKTNNLRAFCQQYNKLLRTDDEIWKRSYLSNEGKRQNEKK